MLRKHLWIQLLEDYPEVSDYMKENMRIEYFRKIKLKIMIEKRSHLEKLKKQSGMDQVVAVYDLKRED